MQQRKLLHCLHSAHQGVIGMKAHVNESVYWPGMDTSIRSIRANCMVCSNIAPSQLQEPIILTRSPDWPFQQIVMDLFHTGDYTYLACTDRLTGWFISYCLEPVHATTTKLMCICRQLFQTYGAPEELSTDSGPPFTSSVFQEFLRTWCVKHRLSPSHISNPMAGQSLAVKTAKRIVNWNTGPPGFLGQWQCCPSYLAVPKHPNPKYWPITGATPTPLPTPGFYACTANPLQATSWMGSGSTTPQGNPPPPQCKNNRKV